MLEHAIRFENINMTFRAKRKEVAALRDISLEVGMHTFTSIVGPSGCGKSTLLSLCAGLKFPSSGRTYCDGQAVEAVNTDIGFVTQDSNLFPWMTLRENVEFPLRVRGVPARDRRARAQSQIDLVGLSGFEEHYPHQLSGGMQKRASIIRTLVYEPDVILMDEPFGALDAQTKLVLQDELLRMWTTRKQTILFVTHDLTEAVALSDQVVVMSGRPGRIKGVFDVDLQRPRDVFQIHGQAGFADNYQQVWDCFRSELIETEGPAATEISA
jgi:NitT/TauT family transport system ATP-binding protein